MNIERIPKRYNIIKATIYLALCTPFFFALLNWITRFLLVNKGIMERWPTFAYVSIPFIIGWLVQKLEYVRLDILTRFFLLFCWFFCFFISVLFLKTLFGTVPQGIHDVMRIMIVPTWITGIGFFLGTGSRNFL